MSGVAPRVRLTILTSSMSLARLLWRYGEDGLWRDAFELSPEKVARVGAHAGELALERPGMGTDAALMAAAIERLEGAIRRPARTRRRPEKDMPQELAATEGDLWSDLGLKAVSRVGRNAFNEEDFRRINLESSGSSSASLRRVDVP
jgi:hypothetical protein